jgi:peptide-methionine (S)-S-oxide reductase
MARRRELLGMTVLAAGAGLYGLWPRQRAAKATESAVFPVIHTDAEWRSLLNTAAYEYEIVGTGITGHAESVRITYDPHVISYGQLLQIFFSVGTDPTQLNRQYPDEGTQYRSEIFTTTPEQVQIAQAYILQLDQAKAFPRAIVTNVAQDTGFYPAEAYHQNFLTLHPASPYIAAFDLPKIAALQKTFPKKFRSDPVVATGQSS